jgi:hypothetical protein
MGQGKARFDGAPVSDPASFQETSNIERPPVFASLRLGKTPNIE